MSKINRITILRAAGGTALALLIWTFSSNTIQDIVVFGAGIYALRRASRGAAAWRQPAGIAFIVVAVHMFVCLPFSDSPADSWRDFFDMLEIFAGAFAIPVIFNTRARLESALLHSANAVILTLAYDIARLGVALGGGIMSGAHSFQPFILNHSNVASSMAGLAVLIYGCFAWKNRAHPLPFAACIVGAFIGFVYQIVLASRGPQITLFLTLFAFGAFIPAWRGKIAWCGVILAAGLLIAGNAAKINPRLIVAGDSARQPGLSVAADSSSTETTSLPGRIERFLRRNLSQRDIVWKHTWRLARQRIWFGHGYGKRNFTRIYYQNNPPAADYYYPHAHQFWMKLLFEFGLTGVALHLAAWLILGWQLLRRIYAEKTFSERLWPATIALMLLFIHIYGLGDYPDNIVQVAQIWLIPAALMVISERSPARRKNV